MRAGLFERGAPSSRKYAGNTKIIGSQKNRNTARQAVRESLVLLKNKNNILPLSSKSNLLITGSGAHHIGQQTGGWSITWQGTGNTNSDFPGATSIYQGISDAIKIGGGQTTLTYEASYMAKPDAAIVVFGETPYAEGQGDLQDLNYGSRSIEDLQLLKKLQLNGIPTIVIFLTGRPLWVNPELNASDAFVVAWLPGTEGAGIADVIIGDEKGSPINDFKGRLSYSWPANAAQTLLNFGDQVYKPLFVYGTGLNYSTTDTLGDNLPEQPYPNGTGPGSNGTVKVFSGRPSPPFSNYVGDAKNWKHKLSGGVGASVGSTVSVIAIDKDIQEDARQISFNRNGAGNYYFQSDTSIDIQSYLYSGGILSLDMKIDSRPSNLVSVLMGQGKLELNDFMNNKPEKVWTKLTIDLKCFSKNSTDFKNLDMPFSIETTGHVKFSIANIEIISISKSPATISCN